MDEFIIEIENLFVEYHSMGETIKAVNGVNLKIRPGETLGLVGETGAGKTTLAQAVMRLLPERTARITDGKILFRGENLLEKKMRDMRLIRGEKISMIFQDPMTSLNPVVTVGEQILEALKLHNREELSRAELEGRTDKVLEMVGIPASRKQEYPHQFSGGMKQRVMIAIALACEPELLIADEPTTALDVTIQAQVLNLMKDLKKKMGTAMLMITHDLGVVARTCDTVAIMYAGEIVEYGTIYEILGEGIHHPYLVGLLGSIPKLNNEEERLHPIAGLMPDPVSLPIGCSFAERCPYACDMCREKKPEYYQEGNHLVRCHITERKM